MCFSGRESSVDRVTKVHLTDVEVGETDREREVQSGERLVVSGRAAGGSQSEVGAAADVEKGPVVCLTHLSHPFSGLTTVPSGSVGSCSS